MTPGRKKRFFEIVQISEAGKLVEVRCSGLRMMCATRSMSWYGCHAKATIPPKIIWVSGEEASRAMAVFMNPRLRGLFGGGAEKAAPDPAAGQQVGNLAELRAERTAERQPVPQPADAPAEEPVAVALYNI